jgi:ubiquinone/menaquinone biosynthesis C-methylase UbiE
MSRSYRIVGLLIAVSLCILTVRAEPPAALKQASPRYKTGTPTDPGGRGKFFMGREIAFIMGHQGAGWLERREREKEEQPKRLLKALDLKPGMIVADIGAGSGYHSFRLAEKVGPKGKVLAVDIQKEMLDIIRKRMKKENVENIEPVLGTETDPKLPADRVDLILMVDVYHEFTFPYEMTVALTKALKPRGRLVFVEFRREDETVPILLAHKMTEKQVRAEMAPHPLKHVKTINSLPWQHVIFFEKEEEQAVGAESKAIRVDDAEDYIQIDTEALQARIRKKGYVSGIEKGTFVDKKTGARELGFGLHIMDFLMAPGWRDDGYRRVPKIHGKLPKHYVEGPQICTQAKELKPEILKGDDFVAVRQRYTFHQPGKGYKAGSTWEQTLVFQPGVRWFFSCERITSVNDVDDLFYRIDMPGHLRHDNGDNFTRIYLSNLDKPIPASEFKDNFGPDEKFLYLREKGKIPERMIRAYQVKRDGKPGPWLAGMTLDPAEVSEAWCHQRGYVCFIEELHRKNVKAGETFGAAYIVGWFDDLDEMRKVYDRYKGKRTLVIEKGKFRLE